MVKKSVYQENVENSIKRNIRLSGFEYRMERDEFLDRIIEFCVKTMKKPVSHQESPKTRHGSGRK